MLTIRQALRMGAQSIDSITPALDTSVLLRHIIGKDELYIVINPEELITDEQEEKLREYIEIRNTGMPVAYILRNKEFMGLNFYVDERVLIPRPDTEILVEEVLRNVKLGSRILDIGTGSGAIAVSIAKLSPDTVVSAVDISEDALKVAEHNANRLGATVNFIKSDLFECVEGVFDIIVSNPPYIDEEEMSALESNVVDFEPHLALYGGEDGLEYYRKIIQGSIDFLGQSGILAFEIGFNQASSVSTIMESYGFENIEVLQDYSGKDRVVIGKKR